MGVCPNLRDMVLVRWCGVTPPAAGSAGGSVGEWSKEMSCNRACMGKGCFATAQAVTPSQGLCLQYGVQGHNMSTRQPALPFFSRSPAPPSSIPVQQR